MATAFLDERSARDAIADAAREIYHRKLSGATDGNLSVRIGPNRIATTPSGVHKGRLRPSDIVVCELNGREVGAAPRGRDGSPLRPSSEFALHARAYEVRPDIGAVVHAHPPMAIAYTLAGGNLAETLVSEVVFACGQIATAPYTTPTTAQVPAVLGDYLKCYDVVVMPRHGSVTVGRDLDAALARLDALEHTATIYCTVRALGGAPPIPGGEVDRLFAIAHPQAPPYRRADSACPRADGDDAQLISAVIARLGSGR